MPAKIKDIVTHFWSLVDIKGENDCWEWKAARNFYRMNYGTFSIKRKPHRAHRIAYEFTFGPIPPGKLVLHSCDNPPCCNPAHLSLGTHKDNNRHMFERGRSNMQPAWNAPKNPNQRILRGEEHGNSKLTAEKVRAIRNLYSCEISQRDLARNFGVSWSLIHAVVNRKIWTHI